MLAYDVAKKMFEGNVPYDIPFEPRGDFQTKVINKVVPLGSHVIGLPMGVGKTPITVKIMVAQKHKSALIVPTDKALVSWLRTMWQWEPAYLRRFVILGKKYSQSVRAEFWRSHAKRRDLHVICNWQLIARDLPHLIENDIVFDCVVGDEYHKFMRNRDTKAHTFMKSRKGAVKLLVSGSPMTKGPIDMFVPLNLFEPKLFSSYWKFAGTWCYIDDTGMGKQVYGARNVEAFRKMLTRYAVIATKKQLGLQKKVRDTFPVRMTELQRDAYEQVRDEMMLELEEGPPMLMLNSMVTWIRMRQILCCPAILDPSLGSGGAILDIYDTLRDLPREEQHCLIFVPFRNAVPAIRAILEGRGQRNGIVDAPADDLGIPVFEFSGGLSVAELYSRLSEFKRTRGIGVCTIQYGESWDAETVDKCWFVGADPDPQVNYQAEDRLDRINNEHGLINCWYCQHEDSIDDNMMAMLVYKQENVAAIYNGRSNMLSALGG